MIKLFRNLRKKLIEHPPAGRAGSKVRNPASPAGRYFFYAIGEIILVVIGILIALQINNWNQELQNNYKEKEYYNKFLEDVLLDEEIIKQEILATEIRYDASNTLVSLLLNDETDLKLISEKLQASVANSTIALKPTTNAYDDLKSSGSLSIIKDDALKFELDQFYSKQTQIMKVIETNGQLLLKRLMNGENLIKTSFGTLYLENLTDTTNINTNKLRQLIEPTPESNYQLLNDAISFSGISRRNRLHLTNLLNNCSDIKKTLQVKVRSND